MGCEYCTGSVDERKNIIDDEIVLYIDGNGNLGDDNFGDTKINFCPMCARPLTKPKPISLEQLRGMDGEKIWAVNLDDKGNPEYNHCHCGWHVVDLDIGRVISEDGGYWNLKAYDTPLGFIAYTHKPDQEGEI